MRVNEEDSNEVTCHKGLLQPQLKVEIQRSGIRLSRIHCMTVVKDAGSNDWTRGVAEQMRVSAEGICGGIRKDKESEQA